MRYKRQLSHKSRRDFLLDAVRALRVLRPHFFTLRPVAGAVNQCGTVCEQAVIPVADTKPTSDQIAKLDLPLAARLIRQGGSLRNTRIRGGLELAHQSDRRQ